MEQEDNELLTLELIHRYVELLDKYFGSVSIYSLLSCKWKEGAGWVGSLKGGPTT